MFTKSTLDATQSVGERVRRARQAKGLTRSALAEAAGITRQYLYQIEEGSRNTPSVEVKQRIAHALGINLSELIEDTQHAQVIEQTEPTAGNSDSNLFWRILCTRASTIQKARRYERNLARYDIYYRFLDELEQILQEAITKEARSAASWAIKAIDIERSARNTQRFPSPAELKPAIEHWQEALQKAQENQDEKAIRAIQWNLGNALDAQLNYKEALGYLETVFATMLPLPIEGDSYRRVREELAGFTTFLGWSSYYHGKHDKALRYFQEAITHWEQFQEDAPYTVRYNGLSSAYRGLGSTYQRLDQFDSAEEAFQSCIREAEKLAQQGGEHRFQLLWGEYRIGSFYKVKGDWIKAGHHLTQAQEHWKHLDRLQVSNRELKLVKTMILNNQADLLIRRGICNDEVKDLFNDALRIAEEIGDTRATAYCYWFLAVYYMTKEEWSKALIYIDKAEPEFRQMNIKRYELHIHLSKPRIYCAMGAPEAAEALLTQFEDKPNEDRADIQSPSQQGELSSTKAYVYSKNKKWDLASQEFENSLTQLTRTPYELVRAKLEYAQMLSETNKFNEAHQQLVEAKSIATKLGAQSLLAKVDELTQAIPSPVA